MKIKKFNQLNESNLDSDLQNDLDDFVEEVDKWYYDNEENVENIIDTLDDLSSIIFGYDEWFKTNKEKIGNSEIDVTIENMTGLRVLNTLKPDEMNNLIKLLQKTINQTDEN